MCYISMDLSRQALQTIKKLFSKFKFVFELMAENRFFSNFKFVFEIFAKNSEKDSNEYRGVNIDEIAICYISMDSSRQSLQTNEKLFSSFEFVFELLAKKRKIIQQ